MPNKADPSLVDLYATAHAIADAARPITLRYFRQPLQVDAKADESPVTIADRETETVMRRVLADAYPDHGIFGEEHGKERLDHRYVWVFDPIDGTRSFITGYPLYCNLVALLDHGKPVLGIVEVPAIGERYAGIAGRGSQFNGAPIKTSGQTNLDEAAIYTSRHAPMDEAVIATYDHLETCGRLVRYGYDAYIYALIAAGHVDIVVETGLEPYDYLSLVPLIEAAGGRITDWQGEPLGLNSKGDVVATASPALHDKVLPLLKPN